MKNYIVEITTGYLIEDNGNLGKNFRTENYRDATQSEIDIWNFNKLKKEKKTEIQTAYDNKVAEGFIYQGNLFDLDQNTITIIHRKLQNQIYLFENNFTFSNRNKDVIDFIDADGFKGLY